MDTVDQEVLKTLSRWIQEGKQCFLATIVSTFSSSPRPIGSIMALTMDNQQIGSLSGGCVEEELCHQLRKIEANVSPTLHKFGINSNESARLGLPCGGQMTVLVEQLFSLGKSDEITSAYQSHIKKIIHSINSHHCISRSVDFSSSKISVQPSTPDQRLKNHVCLTTTSFKQVLGPAFKLIIVGANQVAQYLAQFALALNYHVMICDPRPEAIDSLELSGVDIIQQMPDDFILDQKPDQQCAIVTLTHDPKIDDLALIEALASDAFYVGAMGSIKTSKNRYDRLQNMKLVDLTEFQLNKLHAPVGLSIGSKTPPEIALSIMAELTQLRRLETTVNNSNQLA